VKDASFSLQCSDGTLFVAAISRFWSRHGHEQILKGDVEMETTQNRSRNTLSSRLSVFRPTIVLFSPGASKPWLVLSHYWIQLTVKTSMFYLQRTILSEICCGTNAGQKVKFFNLWGFSTLCHTLQNCMSSTLSRYNQGEVCYVPVCNFPVLAYLHCFGSTVNLQNLLKIKSVPWPFFD
jgi:hypothetical protein